MIAENAPKNPAHTPLNKVAVFFPLGVLAALGSLALEIILSIFIAKPYDETSLFSLMFFASPAVEEILKLLVISKKILAEKISGHIWTKAFLFGMGFFLVELALNIYKNPALLGKPSIPSLFGVFLVHFSTSVIGVWILSKNPDSPRFSILRILILNIMIHLAYNCAVQFL